MVGRTLTKKNQQSTIKMHEFEILILAANQAYYKATKAAALTGDDVYWVRMNDGDEAYCTGTCFKEIQKKSLASGYPRVVASQKIV